MSLPAPHSTRRMDDFVCSNNLIAMSRPGHSQPITWPARSRYSQVAAAIRRQQDVDCPSMWSIGPVR
jgi:hypothetical protein